MEKKFFNVRVLDWNENKRIKVCIITVIQEETQEVIKLYNMKAYKRGYMHWEGTVKEHPHISVHCYQLNESGNISAIPLTEYVLNQEYDFYFCAGTAGAVRAKLYDVIIANQIIYLEKGSNTVKGREYDGKAPEISEKDKNIINTFLTDFSNSKKCNFSVYTAPIYSGENVEKNPQNSGIKTGNHFARHLAAIDMESFGMLQTIRFYESFINKNYKFFCIIRGISDKADDLKNSVYEDSLDPEKRKRCAMQNVLKVMTEFILFLEDVQFE